MNKMTLFPGDYSMNYCGNSYELARVWVNRLAFRLRDNEGETGPAVQGAVGGSVCFGDWCDIK